MIAVSDGSTISWNQEPCNDYSSGDESTGSSSGSSDASTGSGVRYSGWSDSSQISDNSTENADTTDTQGAMVWISATGSKYHSIPNCGNMNPDNARQESESQALSEGYEACKNAGKNENQIS